MARIPSYMLWYRGERVSFVHVLTLEEPRLVATFSSDGKSVTVTVANRCADCIYVYTLDGSEPTADGMRMDGALTIDDALVIRVKAYRGQEESAVALLEIGRVETPVIFDTKCAEPEITLT